MKSRFLLLLFYFLLFNKQLLFSQWIINDSESDSITLKGISQIYNLDFEGAEGEFQKIIKINPDHPSGYFFLAMIDWWKLLIEIENESYDKVFKQKLAKVIEICDARLEKDEFDVVSLFYKCGSIGFRGRLFSQRDSWLKAADDGRLAYPILMKAYKLAPTNYDILLGIGIYDYFAEVIPNQYPILKPIMFFFPKGDKIKGINELRQTFEKARYANIESAYFLLQVYLNYENDPYKAFEIALSLYNRFPKNVLFHRYLGRTYVKLGKWIDVERTFSEMITRAKNSQRGYTKVVEREAEYYLGLYYLANNQYEVSLSHFYRCDELCRELDKKKISGYMIMTNLKIGNIYDLQNKRDLAIIQYKKVLDFDEYERSYDLAKLYLTSAFKN